MAKIFPMFSGSSGNATFVGGGGAAVLVDAGHSATSILKKLENHNINICDVKGIFITHEHTDHIKGLPLLVKRTGIPVYATSGTAEAIEQIYPELTVERIDGCVELEGIKVCSFATSHDSAQSCGYRIELPDGLKFAVCTDLGYVSEDVKVSLCGCDAVLIESNHDVMMLQNGPYPFDLKCRIAGERGHLSNAACAACLPEIVKSGATRIILGHISRENNTPEVALACARSTLIETGLREDYDYILRAAAPDGDEIFYISR